jgi:heterodisulfide reductase subunit B
LREKVNVRLGERRIGSGPPVKGAVEALVVDVGLDQLEVSHQLTGLRVAPYYGCPMTRPKGGYDDTEYPVALDKIIEALGGEPLDWVCRTRCCGGGIVMHRQDVALDLTGRLLSQATALQADCLITTCPLCHLLLDAYQPGVWKRLKQRANMPVLYFTQLMGLAMGIAPKRLGLGRHVISPFPMLERAGVL